MSPITFGERSGNAFAEGKIILGPNNLGSSFISPLDSDHLYDTLFYWKGRLLTSSSSNTQRYTLLCLAFH